MTETVSRRSDEIELWSEELWNVLIAHIDKGQVIPVVGLDLLQVEVEGATMRLDHFLAYRLAKKYEMPHDGLRTTETLNTFACRFLDQNHGLDDLEQLYAAIATILQSVEIRPSKPLLQLAEIKPFKLFVTTNFDTLLEDAINQVRYEGHKRTQSVAYEPNEPRDLKTSKNQGLVYPTVYHLLGQVSVLPSFVVSDEDLLEYICALQSDAYRPPQLFTALTDNHLLILGETFSDWLTRLFLRALRASANQKIRLRDNSRKNDFMVDADTPHDRNLVLFLRHFSSRTRVYQAGGAIEFVDELWRRWQERHPQVVTGERQIPPPPEMPPRAVFLSYSRRNLDAVYQLRAGLEAAGITVWFDLEELPRAQADVTEKIRKNIDRCVLFVPVISETTESMPESNFRKEWKRAAGRADGIDDAHPFIVPVIIDDTEKPVRIPAAFRKAQWHWVRGGVVTPEFVALMKQLVAQVTPGGRP